MKLRWLVLTLLMTLSMVGLGADLGHAAPNVIDFELEIEMKDNNKYDIEYEVNGTQIEAKYQVPGEPVLYGQDAVQKVEEFISKLDLSPETGRQEAIDRVLEQLGLNQADIDDFELEVDFEGGQELDVEFEN
ncbi:YusW family protein [Alteribacter populi]|uniref:YusW family protein n=1 Tax=Alteribacter populi TaxID=2011011 RepID=UPI000BBA8CA2|nr:YusW family protein [Alteribacter populi]